MKRMYDAMLRVEAMNAETVNKAADTISRLATLDAEATVKVEALKALVAIAARPVNISHNTFTNK